MNSSSKSNDSTSNLKIGLLIFGGLIFIIGMAVASYYAYKYYLKNTSSSSSSKSTSTGSQSKSTGSQSTSPDSKSTSDTPGNDTVSTSSIIISPEYQKVLDAYNTYIMETSTGVTEAQEKSFYDILVAAVDVVKKSDDVSYEETTQAQVILSAVNSNRDMVKKLNQTSDLYQYFLNIYNDFDKEPNNSAKAMFKYRMVELAYQTFKTYDDRNDPMSKSPFVSIKMVEAQDKYKLVKIARGVKDDNDTPEKNEVYCVKYHETGPPFKIDYTACNTDSKCVIAASPFGERRCHGYNNIMLDIDFGLVAVKELRNDTPGLYPPAVVINQSQGETISPRRPSW